jgi:cytochrome c oxidase subunit 4
MMRDGSNNSRRLWIGPLAAWVALLVLFAVSLGSAYLPLGTANTVVNLGIAAAMIAVLAAFLMGLRNSTALIRLVAAASGLWIIIMFSLTFADYISRPY